jgi:GTPase SAR1 family protein
MEKKQNSSKIVVLGECKVVSALTILIARVGKTSLTVRFCMNEFDDKQLSTLDATCLEKAVKVAGMTKKLVIWDTAG